MSRSWSTYHFTCSVLSIFFSYNVVGVVGSYGWIEAVPVRHSSVSLWSSGLAWSSDDRQPFPPPKKPFEFRIISTLI